MNTTDRSRTTAGIALVATTAVQALVTMASLTVSIYAPQAANDIGVSPGAIGIYASVTYVTAMLGSLIAGAFILRFGAIRFSQAAMLICAGGLLLCIGAHWAWFVVSALVFGFGYGPTTPASSHILARHTPARAWSLVFSIKQTGVPLGGVLAGIVVPAFLLHHNWQGVTVIIATIVVAGAGLLQLWRRRFDQDLEPAQPLWRGNVVAPLHLVFSHPALRTLAIATFFFSATQQSYVYFLVTCLEVGSGWSTRDAGLALSLLGASAIVGRIAWGAVADRTGRSRAILGIIALVMAAATAASAAFNANWPPLWVYVVCAVFGATGSAWNGVYLAEITRSVPPKDVGRATGGGLFVTFAGVVVAPPLFGLAAAVTGGFALGYLTLAAAGAIVGWRFLRAAR